MIIFNIKNMFSQIKKIIVFTIFILIFILPIFFSLAQDSKEIEECQTVEECQNLLKKLDELILEYEKDIEKTEKEKKTLKNQIYILKKKIEKLNLQISQSNIMIKDLKVQLDDTESSIEKTSLKIEDSERKLINILREIHKEDQKSLIEILLSEKKLSDFFDNLFYLKILNSQNQKLLKNIKSLKAYLKEQRENLAKEKKEIETILKIQQLQRKESEEMKREKDYLLKLTEKEYQKYLKEKEKTEKRAAEIRARIWKLIGVREAPRYEEAVKIAKEISKITGVRAAFLLGILTQESNIGKDVGQCYLRDFETGKGIRFKTERVWPRVMRPSWIPLFLKIIKELNEKKKLNLDPKSTPVSCWIPACATKDRVYSSKYVSIDSQGNIKCHCQDCVPFGWGGAMGPAQLMPFNWIGSDQYKEKIEQITKRVADPWDFYDSVLGAALHLKDCQADLSELEAAACYFGGWANRNNPYHLRVYARPVLWLSKCHQEFIDEGSMSEECERRIF
jgi:peptidoglycan hydrolase CwlO-like protein